jgi:hypothetical protein
MVEAVGAKVAVVEKNAPWSRSVLNALGNSFGVLVEPKLEALIAEEVRGRMHILYVPTIRHPKFELVERIYEYDGKSLIIPGVGSYDPISQKCLNIRGAYVTTPGIGEYPRAIAEVAILMVEGRG